MDEPSKSLVRQFRRRIPPDKKSSAREFVSLSTRETWEFMQEVASEVPYSAFVGRLKVQTFERLRILALSDEFEEVEDDARLEMIAPLDLELARGLPEYEEIRRLLKEAAEGLSNPENAREWVEKKGVRKATRALSRVMRADVADPREGARAGAELLDRVVPKASRLLDEKPPVDLSDEAKAQVDASISRWEEMTERREKAKSLPPPPDGQPA